MERRSLPDLVSSLTSWKLRFALAEPAGLWRAAVVVEDRYVEVFRLERVAPAVVADGLAELQVRYPAVPVVSRGGHKLAEEWTYRFLGRPTRTRWKTRLARRRRDTFRSRARCGRGARLRRATRVGVSSTDGRSATAAASCGRCSRRRTASDNGASGLP